ncbi:hypothetical protein UlMin_012074 [Ulmus minor]
MGVKASKMSKIFVGGRGFKRLKGPSLLTPRGYVPVCVGLEDDATRRFMVRTTLLGDADFLELLYRSAEEYGFCNKGILRIPYRANEFEDWIITKSSSKPNLFKVNPVA